LSKSLRRKLDQLKASHSGKGEEESCRTVKEGRNTWKVEGGAKRGTVLCVNGDPWLISTASRNL
jgi:hypothetical protein